MRHRGHYMWKDRIEQVKENRKLHEEGGGAYKLERQHQGGKYSVWERVEMLLDKNSFVEIGSHMTTDTGAFTVGSPKNYIGDGVLTGWGKIDGRKVCIAAEDFTVAGGTLGVTHTRKIIALQELALSMKVPVVFLYDSRGARIEEGISAVDQFGEIFALHQRASGLIPQICAVLGPCTGGASCSTAMCDFVFAVQDQSKMYISGPDIVESAIGVRPQEKELGSAWMHSTTSGQVHAFYRDEKSLLKGIRKLLSYLPSNCGFLPPDMPVDPHTGRNNERLSFESFVPDNSRKPYDMHLVIENLMDVNAGFFEIHKHFAANVITGFSYLDHRVIGIVANQPIEQGGIIDCDAADKAARFVRFCDCFNIPVLSLVDVPAFLPGTAQEQAGIIRHSAKMFYAFSEATVPKVTLIVRKAYGSAYIAMDSKSLGCDVVYAWPIAQISVMSAEDAVRILYRKQLRNTPQPAQLYQRLVKNYEISYQTPEIAEQKGFIDEVILPEETRQRLDRAFDFLQIRNEQNVRPEKKHGNIPL